jgi:hypothetical protein
MARTDQTAGFSIKGASAAQAWPGPKIRMIITGVGGFSRGTARLYVQVLDRHNVTWVSIRDNTKNESRKARVK